MSTLKTFLVLTAIVAGLALAEAAAGIKGQQRSEESQQRPQAIKGPRQQQLQPILPPPTQQPIQAQIKGAASQIKGAGQIAPIFTPQRPQQPIIQQQEQEAEQQQQQQETEVDPNAAAQDSAPAIAVPAAAAPSEEEANPRPEPYAFGYGFESGDGITAGSSQREETQDANGKITGFYTLRGEDGRDRRVDYIADADGFRATISSNEMGTAPKDSADVDWNAQPPTDAQLRAADAATQAARQRALANPQPLASASAASASTISQGKISSPRQNAIASSSQNSLAIASATKGQQQIAQQLQEPFEQIRQTELNARARKSRHAPFYLFTV